MDPVYIGLYGNYTFYGCTPEERAKKTSFCKEEWCYVDPCECKDDFNIAETLFFAEATGLFWSYDYCCKTSPLRSGGSCSPTAGDHQTDICDIQGANGQCRQGGNPEVYTDGQCNQQNGTQAKCEQWKSCAWEPAPRKAVAGFNEFNNMTQCWAHPNPEASLGCAVGSKTSSAADTMRSGFLMVPALVVCALL